MREGGRRSARLVGLALGELMAVIMASWQHLSTLAVLCFLLCICPTMELDTVSSVSPSPTPAPSCSHFTGMKCEVCIKNTACLWCSPNSTCMDYPVNKIMPPSSLCSLTESYWAICWASLEAIVITIGVVVGIILVFILCCCCYCCRRCRQSSERRAANEEEETFIGDREEKRLQYAQRRHERRVKYDELRRKYGDVQHHEIKQESKLVSAQGSKLLVPEPVERTSVKDFPKQHQVCSRIPTIPIVDMKMNEKNSTAALKRNVDVFIAPNLYINIQ